MDITFHLHTANDWRTLGRSAENKCCSIHDWRKREHKPASKKVNLHALQLLQERWSCKPLNHKHLTHQAAEWNTFKNNPSVQPWPPLKPHFVKSTPDRCTFGYLSGFRSEIVQLNCLTHKEDSHAGAADPKYIKGCWENSPSVKNSEAEAAFNIWRIYSLIDPTKKGRHIRRSQLALSNPINRKIWMLAYFSQLIAIVTMIFISLWNAIAISRYQQHHIHVWDTFATAIMHWLRNILYALSGWLLQCNNTKWIILNPLNWGESVRMHGNCNCLNNWRRLCSRKLHK